MGIFTRSEMCMECAGSGKCPDCHGEGYNADGVDHMVHALAGTDEPCGRCDTTGECPDCDGEGEFEIEEDDDDE